MTTNSIYSLDHYHAMSFFMYLKCPLARRSINNLIKASFPDFVEIDSGIKDLNNICHLIITNNIECVIKDYIEKIRKERISLEETKEVPIIMIETKTNSPNTLENTIKKDIKRNVIIEEEEVVEFNMYFNDKVERCSVNKEIYDNLKPNSLKEKKIEEGKYNYDIKGKEEKIEHWLNAKLKNQQYSIKEMKIKKQEKYSEIIDREVLSLLDIKKGKYKSLDYTLYFCNNYEEASIIIKEMPVYDLTDKNKILEKRRILRTMYDKERSVKDYFDGHLQVRMLKRMNPELKFWKKLIKHFFKVQVTEEEKYYDCFNFPVYLKTFYFDKIYIKKTS